MARLRALWVRVRESLWFIPSVLVLVALLLGVGMVALSGAVEPETLSPWSPIFGAGPDGSRAMLSAIAGSMITVAGVTFSITMVAFTQASSQYTSRILRNFMRDRANQAVLGTFVGIFAYCLVVLRTIRAEDDAEFVPSLAVLMGVLLALVGIGVLIFFVHHIATTLQASEIIARISKDTCRVIDRVHPEELEDDGGEAAVVAAADRVPASAWDAVDARATGYIQHAGVGELVGVAERCRILLRLEQPVGAFVTEGQPLARLAPHPVESGRDQADRAPEEIADAIRRQHVIGAFRTLDRDPAFGIRQLVDIALKAISPGINDSTTAVTCIDYLGAILLRMANRRVQRGHQDGEGRLRVITADPDFDALLRLAVEEIRQHANGNVSVLARLLEMLARVGEATRSPARRRAVAAQVELVREAANRLVASEYDRGRLDALARLALEAAYGVEVGSVPAEPGVPRAATGVRAE